MSDIVNQINTRILELELAILLSRGKLYHVLVSIIFWFLKDSFVSFSLGLVDRVKMKAKKIG